MDRCKWRKMIKEARWSGWVWVGECFLWYRPTRVVPDQRLLNCRCKRSLLLYCSWGELQHLLPNLNALVAISKGMWAVKLCTNRSMQFLSGHSSLCWLSCIMAVKRVVAVCICVCSVCNRNLYLNESLQTRVCKMASFASFSWWEFVCLF